MKIHFVGISGIGMSAVAKICREYGNLVTGSTNEENDVCDYLKKIGITITLHNKKNITKDIDYVCISSAINSRHDEIVAAKELGIPVIHRSELVNFITKKHKTIGISGSHGKSTVTCMIAHILKKLSLDPTLIVGAISNLFNTNGHVGDSGICVAEMDESDCTIATAEHNLTVVTNIDYEHNDIYGKIDHILGSYVDFANMGDLDMPVIFGNNGEYGTEVYNRIASKRKVLKVGSVGLCDIYYDNISFDKNFINFILTMHDKKQFNIQIQDYGNLYIYNSSIAFAALYVFGIPFEGNELSDFSGLKKRMEIVGQYNKVHIISDYAHHPTEILATYDSLLNKYSNICVIIEPHKYSRLVSMSNAYIEIAKNIKNVFFAPIYPAGEDLNEKAIAMIEKIKQYIHIYENIEDLFKTISVGSYDCFVFMGAGKSDKIAKRFANEQS